MAKIVALVKTFSGEEWLRPCVRAIYKHCEKVVFVHSDTSWTGQKGNRVEPIIKECIMPFDYDDKIVNLYCDTSDQIKQCNYGMQWIKQHTDEGEFECDRVFMVDTDEIWDEKDLIRAKEWIDMSPKWSAGFVSNMQSYLRSPYYKISHIDPLKPMIFVPNNGEMLGERGMLTKPIMYMNDVKFHHFGMVRNTLELVLEKLINSHKTEGQKYVDLEYWLERVWFRLPSLGNSMAKEGIHPAVGYQKNWTGVENISRDDFPKVLRDFDYDILKLYDYTEKK